MQSQFKPDVRLLSACDFVTRGGCVADIGTDHAYLPIYLVANQYSARAVAADINEGPINSARANIAAAGLSDRIATLQTDGLHGVEAFAPDDVMIFGMGGELIVRILSEAPWLKEKQVGLILQPMSRAATLRRWLTENGFVITAERITFADKYYQTIAARPADRKAEPYTEEELLLGRFNIEARPPLFEGFLRHEIKVLDAILAGKSRAANADITEETRLKQKLEALL